MRFAAITYLLALGYPYAELRVRSTLQLVRLVEVAKMQRDAARGGTPHPQK